MIEPPLQLLLIDDDETDRISVVRALRAADSEIELCEASDAKHAIEQLRTRAFDCALLDFRQPDLDGLDLLKRAQQAGIKTPIIMLTSQGSEEVAVEMMKAGAADYLPKGRFTPDQLWKSIRTAVRVSRAELREDTARLERQRAKRRLALLADAGAVLGSSLDYRKTLADMAKLTVPHVADWCAIDMLEPDGSIHCLAMAHMDRSKLQYGWELRRLYPIDPNQPHGVPNVLRSGVSELYPEITEKLLGERARDAQHLQIIRELGMTSAMIVPLKASGRVLGAITLISTDPSRHFDHEDLLQAEDLAQRAATAVENACLYQQAEAANRAKDQFLAALSHELRTPLTPVLTMVQALESEPSLSEDGRNAIEMIRRNVELEARLIDDLLDLTRVAKGKLQLDLSLVDVHAIVHNALEICKPDIRAKAMNLSLQLEAHSHHARADAARLQQVLWNLIKNATKFTPQGGSIVIRTSNEPFVAGAPNVKRGTDLLIEVRDSGMGIDADALPRIFDAFEQAAPNISKRFGGLGLGLAISKALIDLHGGELGADSAGAGKGATFTVRLRSCKPPAHVTSPLQHGGGNAHHPAATAHATHARLVPAHRAAGIGGSHRARILMVDDHPDTGVAMQRLLNGMGYDVSIANSVQSALRAADGQRFDVLISDIGLPDGTGLDLVRQLKSRDGKNRALKAIALSGFGMEDDVRRSLEAGFGEHLTKPVNLQRLQELLERMIA